jgi:lysophospholipase L1-like esterase
MSVTQIHSLEAADPDCLDDADAVELLRGTPWRRMVVLGDSVAAGIREPVEGYRDQGFADRVGQAALAAHPEGAYRNLGVRDLRLAAIRDTQLPVALEFGPDLAMVIGGGNDALARSYDAGRVARELREIVVPLSEAGAFVVTIGLFDLARSGLVTAEYAPAMAARFDELDSVTAAVAAEVGALHVDTHHHPRAADPEIFASDRMHANARGHAVAFAAIVRALAQVAL